MFGSNLKILVHAKLPAVLLICFQRGPVTFQSRNAFTMHQLNAICSVKHPPGSSRHIENCGPRLQTANFLVYVALKLQTENSQGQTNCHFHPAPLQAVSFFLARQLWKLAHAWFPFGNSRAYLHRYHVRCDASLKKTLRISKHVLSIPGDYSLVFFPHDPSSLGQTSCSTSSGGHILRKPLKFLQGSASTHRVRTKLSRAPCLSFTGPMLGNNAFYEASFITCQIMPAYHRSLLDSIVNM